MREKVQKETKMRGIIVAVFFLVAGIAVIWLDVTMLPIDGSNEAEFVIMSLWPYIAVVLAASLICIAAKVLFQTMLFESDIEEEVYYDEYDAPCIPQRRREVFISGIAEVDPEDFPFLFQEWDDEEDDYIE